MHLVGLNQFMGSQPILFDKSNGNTYLNEQKTCTDSLKEITYYYKMKDNINLDSTTAESMNDNTNVDSTIAESMNARS